MNTRLAGAVIVIAAFVAQPLAAADSWTPTQSEVARLEAGLRLPQSPSPSGPLKDYARYYAGVVQNGHRMIRGELVALGIDEKARGTVHITSEDEFPVIMDGGCGVVNLLYDVESARIVHIGCNGLA